MVSNIFYFHPYLGKIPVLTNIFQMGWNHQLATSKVPSSRYFSLIIQVHPKRVDHEPGLPRFFIFQIGAWEPKNKSLAILCDLFGMVKWPFKGLSDLQLGNQKVTLNHQEGFCSHASPNNQFSGANCKFQGEYILSHFFLHLQGHS